MYLSESIVMTFLTFGPSSTLDPFAYVSFLHMSQQTRTRPGTLHPCWDQTLIFEKILIYGEPQYIEQDPPLLAVEIYDLDPVVGIRVCLQAYMN